MDKLLKPERFQTEPTDPNAEKLYKHWKLTFNNYLETVGTTPESTPAGRTRSKLFALINNISADVFDIISEAESFKMQLMPLIELILNRPTSCTIVTLLLPVNNRHPNLLTHTCKS